jgi:hypothetical protein
MKNVSILVLFFVLSCAPKESFQQTFAIPIKDYFYSKVGNQRVFTIEFETAIPAALTFESIYFQGQKLIQQETKSNQVQFKIDSKAFVLDADVLNEYGNQPPLEQNSPFKLTPSQAVLIYKINNQVKQYKFKNVTERANF